MKSIFPIIAGSNQPLLLTFSDASTDAAINLTGCTNFTAKAKETETGVVIAIPAVTSPTPASGSVKLEWAADTFATPGLYALQITCNDATGHTLIMPSEAGQLLIRVGAAHA